MRAKLRLNVLLWIIVIYFFAFQRFLTSRWEFLNYTDELFAILTIVALLSKLFFSGLSLKKDEWKILLCWIIICLLGLLCNVFSKLQTSIFLICVDILSMIKVWLAYYSVIITKYKTKFYDQVIISMAKCGRILVVIMFICLIISQFMDIGMRNIQPVYGIIPFRFIFSNPGNFSKLFYFLIPLFTADLNYGFSKYKAGMIVMAMIVWASTMRSRALAFIAIYFVIMFFFFVRIKGERIPVGGRKIKKRHIFALGVLAVVIGWDKLYYYFTTATQARAMLLRYGIVTMMKYFPLGAGFGTFGSDVAATHYSPLYTLYGFTAYPGMRPGATNYLNDNYWPMIMGQFGVIGLVLTAWVLYIFTKSLLVDTCKNKYIYCASLVAVGCLLISSIASKSYCEYSSICIFMLLGVFVKRQRAQFSELEENN